MSECKLPRREEEEGVVGGREEQRQPIRTFSPPERSKIACRRLPHVESPPRCQPRAGRLDQPERRAPALEEARKEILEVPVHGLEEDLRAIALQVAVEIMRKRNASGSTSKRRRASGSDPELRPADHAPLDRPATRIHSWDSPPSIIVARQVGHAHGRRPWHACCIGFRGHGHRIAWAGGPFADAAEQVGQNRLAFLAVSPTGARRI